MCATSILSSGLYSRHVFKFDSNSIFVTVESRLLPFLFTEHPEMGCTAGRHSQTGGPISFAVRCPGMYDPFQNF